MKPKTSAKRKDRPKRAESKPKRADDPTTYSQGEGLALLTSVAFLCTIIGLIVSGVRAAGS